MALFSSIGDFFALDIGTSSVRMVHLRGSGSSRNLIRYGEAALEGNISESDAEQDKLRVSEIIVKMLTDNGVSTRNVVAGIPSRSMFATLIDLPDLSHEELDKSIHYQADQHIPMSIDEAEIDWAKLGPSPKGDGQVEVLLASVSKGYAESRLELLESIGLNVLSIEPDAIALARAMTPNGSYAAPTMILDIGAKATDLVIAMGDGPRLIRGIPTGGQAFIKSAMQNLNIDEKQAQQFVYKFGLNQNKLEGQVFRSLQGPVDTLFSEIEKSIKFFNARYPDQPLDKIIVSGGASTLPEFPLYLANKIGVKVEIANAWQNVSYPNEMYNDLISVSNHYAVAVGLAQR